MPWWPRSGGPATRFRCKRTVSRSTLIAQALIDAHHRGVRVEAILDKSNRHDEHSLADMLRQGGIPVTIDARHEIAHNKVMVIDGAVVITGSFNFTRQAEHSNAENMLVIRDAGLARQYADNWSCHAAHSEPYLGRQAYADDSRHKSDGRAGGHKTRKMPVVDEAF